MPVPIPLPYLMSLSVIAVEARGDHAQMHVRRGTDEALNVFETLRGAHGPRANRNAYRAFCAGHEEIRR
jgi:hypothetical protein